MLNITDPAEARKIIRADKYDKQTAGIAGKYVQGNICILPIKYALDFSDRMLQNQERTYLAIYKYSLARIFQQYQLFVYRTCQL